MSSSFQTLVPRRLVACAMLFMLAVTDGHTAQVCTTERIGNKEFRGISGTSDTNVIAVGKDGAIYRWDGAAWSAMTNSSNEDLDDVEVIGNTAFAVGKNGEFLQLNGSSWTSMSGFTDDDLFGVWAASASEVYVAGKDGAIFVYDGTGWTDLSVAAGTDKDDITDVWGDSQSVYFITEDGVLYHYNRATSTWSAPNSACTTGKKFEDLWGDADGNVYLVGKKDVHVFDGTSCNASYSGSEDLRGVYGWTPAGTVIAVGKKGTVLEYNGSTWAESQTSIEDELKDDWVSPAGNAYYAGKKKELTVCQCTNCGGSPQFVITHDRYGINCQAETIQVQVIDSITGTPRNDYNEEVTLDTQSGDGSWSLAGGSGSFDDSAPDDGLATYTWPIGQSTAIFILDYPQGTPIIDIDVYQSDTPAVRDNDAEGALQFSPNGFTVTDAPISNPPPSTIVPFSASQVAGTDFSVHLAAYGQTPNDPACGIIESYNGPKDLSFWFDYVDPDSGSIAMSVDTQGIPASEVAAASQPVTFINGQATVTAKYKDVGRVQIHVKDDGQAHPDLPDGIRGATAGFVVKPYTFALSAIEDAGGNPNPGAADASGAVFVAAGDPFSVTVTALDAEGSATPNYGQESLPEGVTLTSALIGPAAGDNPSIGNSAGFGAFAGGVATGTNFSWPEVGIISLQPSVADGDYLGAGDIAGTVSGNVGRFRAHHFTSVLNVPTLATGCAAGAYTYIGESFGYSNAPEVSFTARAVAGEVTENYSAGFFKVDNVSVAGGAYSATPATLDVSGLPPASADPVVTDLGGGTGSLVFSSGNGLRFLRGTEEPPFDADIRLSVVLADADGAADTANPLTFGDPGGMVFDGGSEMRFGRARFINAYGSELVDLGLPLRTEYFVDAATGFIPNIDDACSSAIDIALGSFTANLDAGETCVYDNGAPGLSGAGCPAAGPPALRFREPPLGGNFNLQLAAPGAGNDGSVTATADVPPWLEYDWVGSNPGDEDPAGTAVFGIYSGQERRIYIRELY